MFVFCGLFPRRRTWNPEETCLKLAGVAVALSSVGLEGVSRAAALPVSEPELWINRESTRWLWVLARMIDTNSDTKAFVDSAAALHVNVLVVTTGGLIAFYPRKCPTTYLVRICRRDGITSEKSPCTLKQQECAFAAALTTAAW